jgi:hypothetical protein
LILKENFELELLSYTGNVETIGEGVGVFGVVFGTVISF